MSEIKIGSILVSKINERNEILLVIDKTRKNSMDDALGYECITIKNANVPYYIKDSRWFHPIYAKSTEFKKAWYVI